MRRGLWIIGLGIALYVAFLVLAAFEIWGFGKPSDIGGGLLPAAGLVLIAIGIGFVANGWLTHRSRKR